MADPPIYLSTIGAVIAALIMHGAGSPETTPSPGNPLFDRLTLWSIYVRGVSVSH
ncbi:MULTISPECIES: hypothetical protein [Rhodococcus]|uniref:hypothetical protein n=1 Tax=Rhodococcus TaxID=1827 RepID=UPI001E46A2C2|nr:MULTISPECIES: hypothetical protein [Rhodococcus]UOT08098.1 hypothetical protein MPY17_37650 [Rhodococcus opacus]